MVPKNYHLGIDLGSISLKLVLLNPRGEIAFSRWVRVAGRPIRALEALVRECREAHPGIGISSVGVTGSGRGLIEAVIPSVAVNEISAHAAAIAQLYPEVRTIIEIGGQDSKLIVMEDESRGGTRPIRDFSMNELCAAGTGAFLDQQAARLGISIEEFSLLAQESDDPVPIAGRCAVFAKTDMTHHQQEGRPLPDIVAGLNEALTRSYMANLVRGRDLPAPIAFQGGVASNSSLVDAFRRILGDGAEIVVPEHHRVMGAIGAAIKGESKASEASPLDLTSIGRAISGALPFAEPDARTCPASRPLARPRGKRIEPDFSHLDIRGNFLGIDVGSVSVKLVVLGPDGIVDSDYRFSDGRTVDMLRRMLGDLCSRIDPTGIYGVGVTGSGRHFVGKLIGASSIINEISAQALATSAIAPSADTVFEIGGQDAKFMRLAGFRAQHFAMNRVCAAGTGAFLQEQSARLEIDLERDFARAAFSSERPASLGARCTVFMESDLVSHQQMGFARDDLVAGLARSVISNYMEKVVAGHPIGERPVFLGGVAENEAIAAALEEEVEKEVSTSQAGRISGAIGAAISAMEAARTKGMKSSFSAMDANLEFTTRNCTGCAMSCRITSTVSEPRRHFGGRCGKWEGKTDTKPKAGNSLVKLRREALLKNRGVEEVRAGTPRVGIPMALMSYDMLPAWRKFFYELGCEVVISPPTDGEILACGASRLVVETCLPVKAFCSHVAWLQDCGVDFIFVPSLVITGADAHGKETAHCPYIQSLVQFAMPIANTPILNPVVNWKLDPKGEEREMAAIAPRLGRSLVEGRLAWRKAREAELTFRSEMRAAGERILGSLAGGGVDRAFVLLGKDYNVLDERLSSGIATILESKGEVVITQDMLASDGGEYSSAYRTMYWSHGKEMLAAAEIAAATPNLHPVLITSFACGPDSFTIKSAKDIMGDSPLLVLEVDEHSSPVGMETRIEAFLDSLEKGSHHTEPARRVPFVPGGRIARVLLPNFSDHGYAFAAAISALGFEPILTPLPDDSSARLGAKYAAGGECHPYVLMLGDYLRAAEVCGDPSDACYFMPESGACRVGQFGAQMRLAAEEMGVSLPVFTRIEELVASRGGAHRVGYLRALTSYWEIMRGMDFLMQKHLEVRAYETEPGSADAARREFHEVFMDSIRRKRPLEGLRTASELLDRVAVDRSCPKLKIGITGDYYTRICDYANGELFRDIERMGGVIMLPPTLSDFVKIDSRQRMGAAARHKNPGDMALAAALRLMVDRREKRARNAVGSGLDYEVPLEYNDAKRLLAPYMDMRLPAGIAGSVAAVLEQIRAGADGIVNAITFHCNYGLAIGSVLSLIDRDHPDIPKLTLIFEGLKPTHNRLRLEAFMERVRDNSSRRERS